LIICEAVNKFFGRVQVLKDISLTLSLGERLVICGPSGSGKSTLLRCINGLESYDGGRITVGGLRVTRGRATLERIRRQVGLVFQNFNLFPHLTVLQNCTLAPIQVGGMSAGQARAVALDYLRQVHMESYVDSYPSQLSGGQQQRVAIARALCMQPRALMFDEPTSALDPEMTREVLEIISGLSASGMSMVCVTHEMSFARRIADRVIFMDQGQIIEQGGPRELFEHPQTDRLRAFLRQVLREQGSTL
jgi:general L-amino acid transport system ATP-binding protein